MTIDLEQLDATRWRLPKRGGMRVDGIVYADEPLMREILGERAERSGRRGPTERSELGGVQGSPPSNKDESLQQVRNVAHLPGIVGASLAMPDIHWGYGFPIGGVAATDADAGVVSPGGVGYDINCGVRLLCSDLEHAEIASSVKNIVAQMYRSVPTGIGAHRKERGLSPRDLRHVLERGAGWAVAQGFGSEDDLEFIEERGCLPGANPDRVSERAGERGRTQLGTLGSGNHFAELQYVAEIYDRSIADAFGLREGQITVMIHSGSRGLGHQVCQDHLRVMATAVRKYGIDLPDRQLACAPIGTPEATAYFGGMAAAANFAFANRQVMAHAVRESIAVALGIAPDRTGIRLLYDVCHNIAKFETFTVDRRPRRLCVHRKGATRAYPPHHPQTPAPYREVGQPVLIPGDMGRYSYVLAGTARAFADTFGSACHGAGRKMSRSEAKRIARGQSVFEEMSSRGVHVMAAGAATVAEEMPEAYKDVSDVVRVVHDAGIATRVAQLRPIGVIKG